MYPFLQEPNVLTQFSGWVICGPNGILERNRRHRPGSSCCAESGRHPLRLSRRSHRHRNHAQAIAPAGRHAGSRDHAPPGDGRTLGTPCRERAREATQARPQGRRSRREYGLSHPDHGEHRRSDGPHRRLRTEPAPARTADGQHRPKRISGHRERASERSAGLQRSCRVPGSATLCRRRQCHCPGI